MPYVIQYIDKGSNSKLKIFLFHKKILTSLVLEIANRDVRVVKETDLSSVAKARGFDPHSLYKVVNPQN